jgi:predicted Zn finger-like uncharacterized protein
MIITCEVCNTSFNLDEKRLKPTGSKVRCSVCAHVFNAFPQQDSSPEPIAMDTGPDPEMAFSVDEPGEDEFALDEAGQTEPPDFEIESAVSEVLEDAPSDISLESQFLSDPGPDADPVTDSDATAIADLSDEDLNLDFSFEDGDDATATVIADLDADDLDLNLDEPPGGAEAVVADPDSDDLRLDFTSEEAVDGNATVIADLDDEELDLDDDFALQPDQPAHSPFSAADAGTETMDELDELDLVLEVEEADAGERRLAEPPPKLEDDLDLSSLDSLIHDDQDQATDADTRVVAGDDEPELALDSGDSTSPPQVVAADEAGDMLEELAFDLDRDGKPDDLDVEALDDAEMEIDLSEIEKMLEEPETKSADFSALPDQDIDLEIEGGLEAEKWMSEAGGESQLVMDEELDLSGLEQALEDVDTEANEETLEEPELELELGKVGEVLDEPGETVVVDSELDFDLSDFEEDALPKQGTDESIRESADMELEFEVEGDTQAERTIDDEGLEATAVIPPPRAEKVGAAESRIARTPLSAPTPRAVKKGISKSLVFILIIAILGGGGFGAYYLLEQRGIEIPYLSAYLKPTVQDPGYLRLTTHDINSRFIENANVGRLFVISGMVKNDYTVNRGMITVSGEIFATGRRPVQQELVYCGNVMSDLELANLEWDTIRERLANRLGDNRSNVRIEPGESIPFMVVFSDLPDDLEEFTIEVTGSTALQ